MKKKTMTVSESQLINSIDRIVKEQAAMLGFGNMGGLSLGVSKPSDKYELDEDSQDTNTSDTINVNYMDQNAANQNMEDWEMGEDYSIERGSHGHPHDMDEGCGDGEMYEGCGDNRMYESRGILKEAPTCQETAQAGFAGCDEGPDDDYSTCVQGVFSAYAACKKASGGSMGIDDMNDQKGGKTASGVSTGVDRLVRKNLKEIQKNQIRNWVKKIR